MLIGISQETKQINSVKPIECAEEMSEYLSIIASERCKRSFSKIFSYFAPRLRSYALDDCKALLPNIRFVDDLQIRGGRIHSTKSGSDATVHADIPAQLDNSIAHLPTKSF